MEIIFDGKQETEEAVENIVAVLRLFKERYQIGQFREMHLSVTLVDEHGDDVELVDSETDQAYRIFEVRRQGNQLTKPVKRPPLKLVIDNTR